MSDDGWCSGRERNEDRCRCIFACRARSPSASRRSLFPTRAHHKHTPAQYATILLLLYSLYRIYRLSPLLHFSFRTFFVCPVHCRRYFLERSQQVVALLQVHRISRTYQSVRYNTRAVSRSHSAADDRHANRIQYSNSLLQRHFNKRTQRCIVFILSYRRFRFRRYITIKPSFLYIYNIIYIYTSKQCNVQLLKQYLNIRENKPYSVYTKKVKSIACDTMKSLGFSEYLAICWCLCQCLLYHGEHNISFITVQLILY